MTMKHITAIVAAFIVCAGSATAQTSLPVAPSEPREPRAPRQPREPREPREPRQPREPREPRELRELPESWPVWVPQVPLQLDFLDFPIVMPDVAIIPDLPDAPFAPPVLDWSLALDFAPQDSKPSPRPNVYTPAPPAPPRPPAEALYQQARNAIERNQYDRAIDALDRLVAMQTDFGDAATYWRAYSLAKLARTADALGTLSEFQKRFAGSRWLNDARALEAELRQASGQPIAADAEADEEIKLMALRGIMQNNADAAIPVIEKMLAEPGSPRIKERALFVLSQSDLPRAREIVVNTAKGGSNPDVQAQAIRYLGMRAGAQNRQALSEIYRGTNDTSIKRAVIRSFAVARAREELLALARSEGSVELRGEVVRQLGALQAGAELEELYRTESSKAVKQRILQAMAFPRQSERLVAIARTETDPDLRRAAIRGLSGSNTAAANDALLSIYAADTSVETRRAVLQALHNQRNARALIDLARAEKNPEMKQQIVRQLSNLRNSPEATEYLLELLK